MWCGREYGAAVSGSRATEWRRDDVPVAKWYKLAVSSYMGFCITKKIYVLRLDNYSVRRAEDKTRADRSFDWRLIVRIWESRRN